MKSDCSRYSGYRECLQSPTPASAIIRGLAGSDHGLSERKTGSVLSSECPSTSQVDNALELATRAYRGLGRSGTSFG
jgi:hypothetical protein